MKSLINYTAADTLQVSLNKEGLIEIIEIIDKRNDYVDMWLDLTEKERANGEFEYIMPEHIGALTDAPIIGFNISWNENGDIEVFEDSVFYYLENYQVFNEMEALKNGETITFIKAS